MMMTMTEQSDRDYSEILLTVDTEMIRGYITEYDGKYVTETNARDLLAHMENNIRDWFYENVYTIMEKEIDTHIHEIMNPKTEYVKKGLER